MQPTAVLPDSHITRIRWMPFRLKKAPILIEFRIHVAYAGWLPWTRIGDYSTGNGRQMEAIEFRFPNGEPETFKMYGKVHLGGTGWGPLIPIHDHTVLGTTGEGRRLEAVQLSAGLISQ